MIHGDIWWANLPQPSGRRPVLILTRTAALQHRQNVTVAPITRTLRNIPSEVKLTPADGVKVDCAVSLDELLTIRKVLLDKHIVRLSPGRMGAVYRALCFALQLPF